MIESLGIKAYSSVCNLWIRTEHVFQSDKFLGIHKKMEGVPEAVVEVTHGPLVPLEKKMEDLLYVFFIFRFQFYFC